MRAAVLATLIALPGCAQCGHDAARDAALPQAAAADDATLDAEIRAATGRALDAHRRVLLVYVGGDDDADTRLVRRFLAEEPAASALSRGYEAVLVDVKSDVSLHARLRHLDDVRTLVTLVVVDPASGRRVARRVFSPATGRGTVTSATLAAWLDDPRGR